MNILICTMPERAWMLKRLIEKLSVQIDPLLVEIIINDNSRGSIGEKRNWLLSQASDDGYVCFIDDDDDVSWDYVDKIFAGIVKDVDCCSLTGIINERGREKEFVHSIRYPAYHDNGKFYERYPNHLNAIRSRIAKKFRFPEISHGEDTDWATQIKDAKILKSEHWIEGPIYFYDPSSNRR